MIGLGGRMRSSMDYSEIYNNKKEPVQRFEKPVVKAEIEGAKAKPRTHQRANSDYNVFDTQNINGATPKKFRREKTHAEYDVSGMAGSRPQAAPTKQTFHHQKSQSSSNVLFG